MMGTCQKWSSLNGFPVGKSGTLGVPKESNDDKGTLNLKSVAHTVLVTAQRRVAPYRPY